MRLRRSTVIALALAIPGCVGAPQKLYPGPERAPSEVAVLRDTAKAIVMMLDSEDVSGTRWALLPGRHQALLRVKIYNTVPNVVWKVWSYCEVDFEALAGGRYRSLVRVTKETTSGLGERLTMEVGIATEEGTLVAKAHTCTTEHPAGRE